MPCPTLNLRQFVPSQGHCAQGKTTIMSAQTELFRIVATIGQTYRDDSAGIAAQQILDWAAAGLEKPLPKQAWDLQAFKHFTRGANCACARILGANQDVWAIRLDKTDETGPQCIRSTEAVVERHAGKRTRLTVRQMVDRFPRYDLVPPGTPAFVHDIDSELGLYSLWEKLESEPWVISSEEECQRMIAMLVDSTRMWPALVLTVPQDSPNAFQPLLDPVPLARATTGLARVVVLPHQFTWDLTNRFGKELSVYLGAVRVYLPGFHGRADPWAHDLVLARRLETEHDREAVTAKLQRAAAESSLRRFELGRDLFEFAKIRTEAEELARRALARQVPQRVPVEEPKVSPPPPPVNQLAPADPVVTAEVEKPPAPLGRELKERPAPPAPPNSAAAPPEPSIRHSSGPRSAKPSAPSESAPPAAKPQAGRASWFGGLIERLVSLFRKQSEGVSESGVEAMELEAAQERIATLQADLRDAEELSQLFSDEHAVMEERAKSAESDLAKANSRIDELENRLARLGANGKTGRPSAWSEFSNWCEQDLSGKIMLSERAKREVKKPKFKDVELAANGLLWLADEYRNQRLRGGGKDLRGPNSSGLSNEPCGGTRFTIPWGGRQRDVKWHLKNGGNTHDPTRCLRIYYFWDETNEQVVIALMPAHYRIMGR